jgi:hypothetical protein
MTHARANAKIEARSFTRELMMRGMVLSSLCLY